MPFSDNDPMECPRCVIILAPTHTTGNRFRCPQCNGVASTTNDLGLLIGFAGRRALIGAADEFDHTGLKCPFCQDPMSPVELRHELGSIEVDVCRPCEAVWTDQGEITKLSKSAVATSSSDQISMSDNAIQMGDRSKRFDDPTNGKGTRILEFLVELLVNH